MHSSIKNRIIILVSFAMLCFLTSCTSSEDLSALPKRYLDATHTFYYEDQDLAAFEKTLDETTLPDLKESTLKSANDYIKILTEGFEFNGEQKSAETFYDMAFAYAKKVEEKVEISKVYDDLDKDREGYKYVFVRINMKYIEADDSVNEIPSSINLFKYFIQKNDDKWRIYSNNGIGFFPYGTENATREFNGEDIEFIPYKTYTIDLDALKKARN